MSERLSDIVTEQRAQRRELYDARWPRLSALTSSSLEASLAPSDYSQGDELSPPAQALSGFG